MYFTALSVIRIIVGQILQHDIIIVTPFQSSLNDYTQNGKVSRGDVINIGVELILLGKKTTLMNGWRQQQMAHVKLT